MCEKKVPSLALKVSSCQGIAAPGYFQTLPTLLPCTATVGTPVQCLEFIAAFFDIFQACVKFATQNFFI